MIFSIDVTRALLGEENGATQVAAIDPLASMAAVDNAEVKKAAAQVGARLKAVVDGL